MSSNYRGLIDALKPKRSGDHYHDGFYECRDQAYEIMEAADKLIDALLGQLYGNESLMGEYKPNDY